MNNLFALIMFIDKIFLKFYIYVHRRAVIKSIMIYKGVAFTILGGSQHSLFARMPDDTRLLLTYTYTEQNEQQNLSYGYNPPQLYTTHATWIPTLLQESLLPLQPDVAVMGSCFVVGSLLPCRVRKLHKARYPALTFRHLGSQVNSKHAWAV